MKVRALSQVLICGILSLTMVVNGSWVMTSYGAETSNAIPEDNLESARELLEIDGESTTEDALEEDQDIEFNGYIYKLKDSATPRDVNEMEKAAEALDGDEEVQAVIEDELYVADSIETISQVVDAEKIDYIEPNLQAELMSASDAEMNQYIKSNGYTAAPNDEFYNSDYGWVYTGPGGYQSFVNAPAAWARNCYGQDWNLSKGITVVTIDTGASTSHPDQNRSRMYKGVTFYNGTETAGSEDEHGHGTFVAGLINARMNNSIGITGFMPDLYVYPVKVFKVSSSGSLMGGYVSDIILGIKHAVSIKADVINMSIGLGSKVRSLEDACDSAVKSGLIIVASSGNNYDDRYNYPASYSSVISVGSIQPIIDTEGNRTIYHSSFSNYNETIDVVAPGETIAGLYAQTGGYRTDRGTSFSTPIVSALAGMCKGIDNNITAGEFRSLLIRTSDDIDDGLGGPGRDDYYGYGVVNFGRAAAEMLDDSWGRNKIDISGASVTNLTGKTYKYTGNRIKPRPTVTVGGVKLVRDLDYSLSYSNNLSVGKATVKITGVGRYSGSISKTFSIKPKGTTLKSVTRSRNYLTFRWGKQSEKMATYRITGYQVQLARNSDFTKSKKSYIVKGYTKVTRKFSKLKRRTYYYARVRTYKTVNGVRYYSPWSKVEKVKTL